MPITTLVAGNVIRASTLNTNFESCVLRDTAGTISVTHAWSASQTFTGGFTTGAAVTLAGNLLFTDATYDIGASGATRPRDFFLSRNAVVGGTLGVTGVATFTAAAVLSSGATVTTGGFTVSAGTTAVQALTATSVTATAQVYAGAAMELGWNIRAKMRSPSDGVVTLYNDANTDFSRLQFGGTTAAFPSWRRNGTTLAARLADDSADSPISCSSLSMAGALTGATTGTFSGAVSSSSATGGIGYAAGAGGTVTQLTDKGTAVTINKVAGQITTNNAALAAGAEVAFTVNNSTVAATDTIVLSIASDPAGNGAHQVFVSAVASGSFNIAIANLTTSSQSQAVVINFAVIKGVTS